MTYNYIHCDLQRSVDVSKHPHVEQRSIILSAAHAELHV